MPDELKDAAAAPQAPSPSTATPKADDYDPQWLGGLSGQRRTDVDQWAEHYHQTKRKELDAELQSLRTKLGVANKAADPAIVAMLGDHDTFLGELKQAAVTLYGVTDEDVKDAQTVRELRLLMRGLRTAQPKSTAPDPAAGSDPATQDAWKAFLASRNGAPAQQKTESLTAPSGGVPHITADNIDALHLEGKVSDDRYRRFLKTGQL